MTPNPRQPGVAEIRIPSERAFRERQRRRVESLVFDRTVVGALRALATEGIQRGHMSLHARQVAIAAGASGELIEKVAAQMVAEKVVRIDRAEELVKEYTRK